MKTKNILVFCLALLAISSCGDNSNNNDNPGETPVVPVLTPKETFLKAKNNIQSLKGYSYTDSLEVKVDTSLDDNLDSIGIKNGTVNYSSTYEINKVSYYQLNGALFFDGERYEIDKDNTKRTIDLKEDGSLKKIKENDINENETSTFAKAIFEYDDSKIKDVTKDGNVYTIITTVSASTVIEDAINIIDSNIVRNIVGKDYPSLTPNYTLTATIENDLIKTFNYSFNLTVLGQTLEIDYSLNFSNYEDKEPSLPSNIPGISISDEELKNDINELNNYLSEFRNLERSGYEYKSVVDIDFMEGGTLFVNDVSTTIQGETKRILNNSNVYYENRVEMDTSMPDFDSEDYERYRVKTLGNKVYDVENKLFGDEVTEVLSPLASDEYYFLIGNLTTSDLFYILDNINEDNSYEVVLNDQGVNKILEFIENNSRMDVNLKTNESPLGEYKDLEYETAVINFEILNNNLNKININIEGEFNTVISNYKTSGLADFNISLVIEIDNSLAEKYEIPENESDINI